MEFLEKSINTTKWIATSEEKWIEKWDEIQRSHPLGMFTQTSSWLKSYQAYGFEFELLLEIDLEENIHSGFGNLLAKAGPFKVYYCPWGPFLSDFLGMEEAILMFIKRAKTLKAFAAQINPPIFNVKTDFASLVDKWKFQNGDILKKIYTPTEFNIIGLPTGSEESDKILLKKFSENARRNIKAGLKNQLQLQEAKTIDEIEKAYRCFEANAEREGYSVRSLADVSASLKDAVQKGNSIMYYVENEGSVVGAIWVAKGGQMLSYIMGGVDRTQQDLKLGHLLQWHCMNEAMKFGYSKYNISVGGNEGVARFKNSFYPSLACSSGPVFLVLNSWYYFIFKSIFPFFEKNKNYTAKLLKLLK